MKKVNYRDSSKIIIDEKASVKQAINILNETAMGIIFVTGDNNKLVGTITDGDIRRALIDGGSLDESVTTICNKHPKSVHQDDPPQKAEEFCLHHRLARIPVLDEKGKPIGIYFLEDFVKEDVKEVSWKTNPVVIMAGGKGTRLEPFTRILPKPLIPLGHKAAIELIIDNFFDSGFKKFILSVNYRKEFIKMYFDEMKPLGYELEFVEESRPLDTIGSLSLMKDILHETFVVSNCDMILEVEWSKALEFHKSNGNMITMLGALKDFKIPYGVIQIEDQMYMGIMEKPEYNFLVNLGVYIMEPSVLDLMKSNEPMSATDLVEIARSGDHKVGVYPIYNRWFDIGQWEEYQNTIKHFEEF